MREQMLSGEERLNGATALLQRVRNTHPTAGLMEAADYQWWSIRERSTDHVEQLFWFDADDLPVAAVLATDWNDGISLDVVVMPDSSTEWIRQVVGRGVAHAQALGFGSLEVMLAQSNEPLRSVLLGHGFVAEDSPKADAESWLIARDRPSVSPLPDGYTLFSRTELTDRPHHMVKRGGNHVEASLCRTSLYRPDLDLVVLDAGREVAGYGLFWFDPVTGVGLVEPMRTEDEHQRRGIARHIITSGIQRLADAGAERIKIVYNPQNQAAKDLYLDVGFVPSQYTEVLKRPAIG